MLELLQTPITVLHITVCAFLVLIVLIQPGKSGGLGAALGGAGAQQVFGGRGAGNFLSKLTWFSAGTFFVTSMLLAYISSSTGDSLADREVTASQVKIDKAAKDETTSEAPASTNSDSPAPSAAASAPSAAAANAAASAPSTAATNAADAPTPSAAPAGNAKPSLAATATKATPRPPAAVAAPKAPPASVGPSTPKAAVSPVSKPASSTPAPPAKAAVPVKAAVPAKAAAPSPKPGTPAPATTK